MKVSLALICVAAIAFSEGSNATSGFEPGDPRLCLMTDRENKFPVKRFEALPGTGWDNLQNKPKGQITQFNYTKCLTTADGRFLIPDQVFTVPIKQGKVDTFAQVIDSWHNTSSLTSDSVNANAGLGFGGFSISGSFSREHTEIKKTQIEDKASTVRVQLRYLRYKALLQPDSQFHLNFKRRLLSIAASLQLGKTKLAYYEGQLLIRDYGTHVLTSVTAGASLAKTDYLKRSYMASQEEDKTKVLASASASYCSFFGISGSYSHTTDKKDLQLYEKNKTHSFVENFGGPLLDPARPNISRWYAAIDDDLVAMDRSGDPLSFLITEEALPDIPINLVFQLRNVIHQAIITYYKMNTYNGCTKFGSPNFSPVANFDDGTCATEITNMTFGGVYQTCEVTGTFLSNNPCTGMSQKHPKTAAFSCPSQYTAVPLFSGTKAGKPESKRECHRCHLFFHCCHTNTYQATAKYTTYWCAATGAVSSDSGYLYGGIYSDTLQNPLTGSKGCPRSFYPLQFMDRHICISDDFEIGRQYAAPFGGFFSCSVGNPLAMPSVTPVGLKALPPHSLDAYMATISNSPATWPKHCPKGYSQHVVAIEADCEINYCLKSGSFASIVLPSIKLPPFSKPPETIPATEILTMFNEETLTWVKETSEQKFGSASASTSEGDDKGMSPGAAAGMGVMLTLAVVAFVVGAVVFHRRRQNLMNSPRLLPESEDSVQHQLENSSGSYGATSPAATSHA